MRVTRNQQVSREKLELARSLRRTMTPEERILWQALRSDKLAGIHFRRQQVIAGFVVDFYCASACLAVEIDGASHNGREDYDVKRDRVLSELGIRTLRIGNQSVTTDLDTVLRTILGEVNRIPSEAPSSEKNAVPRSPLLKTPEGRGDRGEVKRKPTYLEGSDAMVRRNLTP